MIIFFSMRDQEAFEIKKEVRDNEFHGDQWQFINQDHT
jgi:hypothetical protein